MNPSGKYDVSWFKTPAPGYPLEISGFAFLGYILISDFGEVRTPFFPAPLFFLGEQIVPYLAANGHTFDPSWHKIKRVIRQSGISYLLTKVDVLDWDSGVVHTVRAMHVASGILATYRELTPTELLRGAE